MEHDEFDLISIDRSMGESRFSQLCGVVLLIALIVGTWLYKKELTGGAKWVIVVVAGFIAGYCLMAMKYDYILDANNIALSTHAVNSGLPIDLAWGLKLIWTIAMIAIAIALIICPSKKKKEKIEE